MAELRLREALPGAQAQAAKRQPLVTSLPNRCLSWGVKLTPDRVFLSLSFDARSYKLAQRSRGGGSVSVSVRLPVIRLRLIILVIALACLVAPWVAVTSALAAGPRLVQEDLVTSKASSVPSANAWGANADRLVRARNGDLYTTYVTRGADSEHFRWVLAERRAGSVRWKTVTSGVTTHQPGNPPAVLIGPSGTVFVITISPWDRTGAGAPRIWDSVTRKETTIRGRWLTGRDVVRAGSLYPAASIDAKGDIYVWENVPCPYFRYPNGRTAGCRSVDVPGTVYWAYRRAGSRAWHSEQWVSAFRYAYDFLLPQGGERLTAVGTRDILQAPFEAPYPCPNGSDYCFDQTVRAQWRNLSKAPSSVVVARAAADAPGYSGAHLASAEDAYVDTEGRTHVLVSVIDASTQGTYENHQLLISGTGTVKDVAYLAVPYPNLSRIVQDMTNRFWIYSLGPSPVDGHRCEVFIAGSAPGSTDGTELGPTTVIPLAHRYDCARETRNYDVSVRSGTPRAGFIDGVVATNGGADWVHYRILLPTAQVP
jgi:hypothetical protein